MGENVNRLCGHMNRKESCLQLFEVHDTPLTVVVDTPITKQVAYSYDRTLNTVSKENATDQRLGNPAEEIIATQCTSSEERNEEDNHCNKSELTLTELNLKLRFKLLSNVISEGSYIYSN